MDLAHEVLEEACGSTNAARCAHLVYLVRSMFELYTSLVPDYHGDVIDSLPQVSGQSDAIAISLLPTSLVIHILFISIHHNSLYQYIILFYYYTTCTITNLMICNLCCKSGNIGVEKYLANVAI